MKKKNKGFTLMEMLIVVAIIAILIAIAIPTFTKTLERSREAADLANVRNAYSQVLTAAIWDDTHSPLYQNGTYQLTVRLQQAVDGWTMNTDELNVGGIRYTDDVHWKGKKPRAKGKCRVYYSEGEVYLNWAGEDHINDISAKDFLTSEALKEIVGDQYKYTVINSNETYGQGGNCGFDGKFYYDTGIQGETLGEPVDPFAEISVTEDGCLLYELGMILLERA